MEKEKQNEGSGDSVIGQTENLQKITSQDDGLRWFMKKQTVKDKIRDLNCQIADNFFPRLNEFIEDSLIKAVYRTKCNKRKTVRAMDI